MSSNFTKRAKQLRVERPLTSGTISIAPGSTAIVGTGTVFTSDFGPAGNVIRHMWVGNDLLQIASVTDDTHATLLVPYATGAAAGTAPILTAGPLYTVANGLLVGILHSLFVSNNYISDSRMFKLRIYDASQNLWVTVGPNIEVPLQNAYSHPKPINLLVGDMIQIAPTTGSDFDMHAYSSIVEKS